MDRLIFAFNTIAPVFLIVFVGIFLRRIKLIDEHFVAMSSTLVFKVTIPALIFINIAKADFGEAFQGKLILFSVTAILLSFVLIFLFSFPLEDRRLRSAFIQGAFRSNYAILGLALLMNLFGSGVLPTASVLLTFIMPLFNLLSIVALIHFRPAGAQNIKISFFRELFSNPLVLAAIISLPFSFFNITIPYAFSKSIDYLASLTMPLALLGIGGTMSFAGLQKNAFVVSIAAFIKLLLIPACVLFIAVRLGFRGESLGILLILFGTPTAIVSFIMAKAMDSDALFSANLIVLSTLGSIGTLGMGIFILKSLGLI